MQKKLLALAIAGLVAGYASAEVKVYGQLDVSMNNYDDTKGTINPATGNQTTRDDWELESNASRIGFKADYAITEELRAIAKIEYEVFVDDGDDNSDGDSDTDELKSRNIYAGLQGNWGSVIAGKHDTLVKLSQGKVDRFNDLPYGDIKHVMVGENRQDNIVIFSTNEKSKAMQGFQLSASFMPGEEDNDDTVINGVEVDKRDSAADGYGFSATYTGDRVYLAAALDKDVTPDGKANLTDITRIVGEVKVTDGFKVGALWQTAEEGETGVGIGKIDSNSTLKDIGGEGKFKEQDAWLVSAEWAFAKNWILKGQYAESKAKPIADGADDSEIEQIAIGVDYIISKEKSAEAKVYAYIAKLETPREDNNIVTQYDASERETFAVGYQLKF
jgi:predicted porin